MKHKIFQAYACLMLAALAAFFAASLADFFHLGSSRASADIYFAATAAGANNGTNCANAFAYNNGSNGINVAGNWSPGNGLHICGMITASAGGNVITAQANGSGGAHITIKFEGATAILSAPYFGTNCAINLNGKQFIDVDGGGTGNAATQTLINAGTIQNTANGDALANQQISCFIKGSSASNNSVQNLILANLYVAVQDFATPLGATMTQINAIIFSGQNWTIKNNTIHDCGWCLWTVFGNSDTGYEVAQNEIYNWDHGEAFTSSSASTCTDPCLLFHDNNLHDNAVFEQPNSTVCTYHLDGLHIYNPNHNSTANGFYVYNNWFHGVNSGPCSSGFLFVESGANAIGMTNSSWWNNVFDASGTINGINSNGWVGIFNSSVSMFFAANTMVETGSTTNTVCYNIGSVTGLTFEDNVVQNCGIQIKLGTLTTPTLVDYNVYGKSCQNGSNCFAWNGTYQGNFATWKTTLSGASVPGADAHSLFNLTPNMNSDGTPLSNYIGIQQGANLTDAATGNLATLSSDTTKAGNRAALARPSGTCASQGTATCWDVGAFQVSNSQGAPAASSGAMFSSINAYHTAAHRRYNR